MIAAFKRIGQPVIATKAATVTAMPIAELLAVQFDMQLLLKLSISLAATLLVSWAYRYYSSRDARKIQVNGKDNNKGPKATCRNCKTSLQSPDSAESPAEDEDERVKPSNAEASADLTSDRSKETAAEERHHQADKSEDAFSVPCRDRDTRSKREMLSHREQESVTNSNISFGSALNLPHPTESRITSTTGRRSPCFLQKLDGSVGVGRELRQDLERQGAYSSFLSKAEIKVEDANLVLEGTGDQIARGKIYSYYVQSSSHSVTDSNAVPGQFERISESQPGELGSRSSSLSESPPPLSPAVIQDLILPQSPAEDPSSEEVLELKNNERPVLLRKESYLSATEQSELSISSLKSRPTPKMSQPLAASTEESNSVQSKTPGSTVNKDHRDNKEEDVETAAGAQFLHFPACTFDSTNAENVVRRLDLGNCLETLYLAKEHGQNSVQQAALRVMSDNYLQVLRDPAIYGRLMADEREQIRRQRTRGKKHVMVADVDLQDLMKTSREPGQDRKQDKTSSALYYYDDCKNAWQKLCRLPPEVCSGTCAMCTMDNYLFVAVGCTGTDREMTPSKQVFCFNPLTSIWKEVSPMNTARPRCKLAAVDGCVYAIGGECLSSVERYDPREDRWTFVAPLPNDTFAVAHHVTVCNGELFVSGGTLRYMLLRYSPKSDAWRSSLLAGSKDRTAALAARGRFLYRFDINPVLGVSVYRYHTVARLWYECSSKRLQHCPSFQCVTLDDAIYCISRQFTLRFQADEVSPAFADEDLSVLLLAKGVLYPFVLSLPDKRPQQTSV